MNVLFLLTPKKNVLFLTIDMSVSMALDQLKNVRYSSVPLLDTDGHFVGTITEGDLLWHLENSSNHDQALTKQLVTLKRFRDYKVAKIDTILDDLFLVAINQNYIPIVDDRDYFIGIITRKEIISYFNKMLREYKGIKYNSDNPGLQAILRRRSIRQFKDEVIEKKVIEDIIKAGLVAPSGKNKRPIHIYFVDNKSLLHKFSEFGNSFSVLGKAPYAFFIFGDQIQEDNDFLLNNDASAVTMNLLNAISSFNLGGVWLGAAKHPNSDALVREMLKVDPRYKFMAIVAFGVSDENKDPYSDYDFNRVHLNKW